MERLRRKRPTSPDFPSVQGNGRFQNQRNYPKPASSDSDSDSFTFELGLRSSRQTPMKKLLAKEMSAESESRRRSPSVVAKLMGLDALPCQPRSLRQEQNQSCCSEFKDVFEVPSKPDMAFIRQKFMDAKRLSTRHELHDSKEFNDALDALDSNKDLLLKFLQQPDSLFAKHRAPTSCAHPRPSLKLPQPTRIVVLKPNLGKLLRASECRKDREIPLVPANGRRNSHSSHHKSRELAKEITRQMRSGDESSCSVSGNELDMASTSSKYSESSVSREAKKRLSERWKMNSRDMRAGGSSRGSTLADMLAMPDKDRIFDARGLRKRHLDLPLGISSREGWKEGCLTRSRSLPSSSSTLFGSPKAVLREDRYVVVRDKNKGHKKSTDINSRSHSATSYPSHYLIRETDDTSLEPITLPEKKAEDDIKSLCVDNSALGDDVCNDDSSLNPLQEPQTEPHASSKEADQPSPVSVLEVPFTDDLSSCSDCFESLNADLQGLRMQLKLLKLESESYEGGMEVSSDEEGSIGMSVTQSLCKSQQSWECCYVVDVLSHSGLAAWCPISPWVFDKLEKESYGGQTMQPKSERKLLFDRMNDVISEEYGQLRNPRPWVSWSSTALLAPPRWSANELQDTVFRLLASQEKKAKKETAGKVVGKESQWLDIGDDLEVIGGDIEKLLYEELVDELVG